MGLLLKVGEDIITPKSGYKEVMLDDAGDPQLLDSDGSRVPLGGGTTVTTDGTLDGDGSALDPLTVLSAPTADAPTVATTFSAALGLFPSPVTTLADADVNVTPGTDQDCTFKVPDAATADRTYTLQNAGATVGLIADFIRNDGTAHAVVIKAQDGTTLHTIVSTSNQVVTVYFSGAAWILSTYRYL